MMVNRVGLLQFYCLDTEILFHTSIYLPPNKSLFSWINFLSPELGV